MFVIGNIQSFTSQIFGVVNLTSKKFWSRNPQNQSLLSQSFETLSEWQKFDIWLTATISNLVRKFLKHILDSLVVLELNLF